MFIFVYSYLFIYICIISVNINLELHFYNLSIIIAGGPSEIQLRYRRTLNNINEGQGSSRIVDAVLPDGTAGVNSSDEDLFEPTESIATIASRVEEISSSRMSKTGGFARTRLASTMCSGSSSPSPPPSRSRKRAKLVSSIESVLAIITRNEERRAEEAAEERRQAELHRQRSDERFSAILEIVAKYVSTPHNEKK
tara:strand:- start:2654 stop:3241 length:588 start_codon:yes stop_codon:yes gene_type:complete